MMNKMKKAALSGLALAATTVLAPAAPASAHIHDDWAHWYCAYYRTPGTVITHAVPIALDPGYSVVYYCRQGFFGVEDEYTVYAKLPLGTSSLGPWGMIRCAPHGPASCTDHTP